MRPHRIVLGAFATIVVPQIAEAAWGQALDSLNVRVCAGTQCPLIGVLRAGAQVWVGGSLGGWYQVNFNGESGYVSARHISLGYVASTTHYAPVPVYVTAPQVALVIPYPQYVIPAPAQPFHGFAWPGYQHYGPWYEGRLRYFGHRWH